MTDAFARPTIRVLQSARPRIQKFHSSIRIADDAGRLRVAHRREAATPRPLMIRLSAAFSAKRSALLATLSTEFAYKIAVAMMNAEAGQHAAIIAALKAEQDVKTSVAMTALSVEEKTSTKQTNRSTRRRRSKPARPQLKSSMRFSALKPN